MVSARLCYVIHGVLDVVVTRPCLRSSTCRARNSLGLSRLAPIIRAPSRTGGDTVTYLPWWISSFVSSSSPAGESPVRVAARPQPRQSGVIRVVAALQGLLYCASGVRDGRLIGGWLGIGPGMLFGRLRLGTVQVSPASLSTCSDRARRGRRHRRRCPPPALSSAW